MVEEEDGLNAADFLLQIGGPQDPSLIYMRDNAGVEPTGRPNNHNPGPGRGGGSADPGCPQS